MNSTFIQTLEKLGRLLYLLRRSQNSSFRNVTAYEIRIHRYFEYEQNTHALIAEIADALPTPIPIPNDN